MEIATERCRGKPTCSSGRRPSRCGGGLFDTAGNVFEWIQDCWNPDHQGAPKDAATRTTGDCNNRVIRGGSFYYLSRVANSSYRVKNPSGVKSYWLGFRVVRELK